jgi:hypothetical protein
MQKLKGINSGQNNKGCSINHHGSNKIGFTFSEFSVSFYAIYNFQQFGSTIGVTFLQKGPWKDLKVCNAAPMAG